ncbi:hypothetical protein BC830DRAFT_958421 [Chytriomyces sp. MP71]|nr:hypothetical protein BC830DRAFT_958421 [Chytriomyces sp. MP71]
MTAIDVATSIIKVAVWIVGSVANAALLVLIARKWPSVKDRGQVLTSTLLLVLCLLWSLASLSTDVCSLASSGKKDPLLLKFLAAIVSNCAVSLQVGAAFLLALERFHTIVLGKDLNRNTCHVSCGVTVVCTVSLFTLLIESPSENGISPQSQYLYRIWQGIALTYYSVFTAFSLLLYTTIFLHVRNRMQPEATPTRQNSNRSVQSIESGDYYFGQPDYDVTLKPEYSREYCCRTETPVAPRLSKEDIIWRVRRSCLLLGGSALLLNR